MLLNNGVVPYLFTITQSTGQIITVSCTHNGVTTQHTESFIAYSRDTWTATISAETGYSVGTLSATSGTVMSDVNIYATSAQKLTYTFTITQSTGATITVTCGGQSHTSSFTAEYGQEWTATFSRATGYTGGVLNGTSGTVTGATTVKFNTAPSLLSYTFTITQAAGATITVTCAGVAHTSTFTAYYGQTWTATFGRGTGYAGGTLNATSGTVTANASVYFTAAPYVAYAKTIYTSGSNTWTAPAYINKVRYTIVGGGGGGLTTSISSTAVVVKHFCNTST